MARSGLGFYYHLTEAEFIAAIPFSYYTIALLAYMLLNYLQFQAADYDQQDAYVQANGNLIAHRWHGNYCIELYELGSFYCERWLEQECLELHHYRAYGTDACLEAYSSELCYLTY